MDRLLNTSLFETKFYPVDVDGIKCLMCRNVG